MVIKFLLLTSLTMLLSTSGYMKNHTYTISEDPKNGSVVFRGKITMADLYREATFDWMREGVDGYQPVATATNYLKGKLSQFHIVAVLGTWCGDSKDLVPKLYKVLDEIHFPVSHLTMYGVDRTKTTESGEVVPFKIELVPTFIVLDGVKEVGRITESAENSVEEDLVEMLRHYKTTRR